MRLIDADALEELFREVIGGIAKKPEMNGNLEHMVRASAMVIEMIKDAPTVEPKRGEWIIKHEWANGFYERECSICGAMKPILMHTAKINFCPNCGADMREREGE